MDIREQVMSEPMSDITEARSISNLVTRVGRRAGVAMGRLDQAVARANRDLATEVQNVIDPKGAPERAKRGPDVMPPPTGLKPKPRPGEDRKSNNEHVQRIADIISGKVDHSSETIEEAPKSRTMLKPKPTRHFNRPNDAGPSVEGTRARSSVAPEPRGTVVYVSTEPKEKPEKKSTIRDSKEFTNDVMSKVFGLSEEQEHHYDFTKDKRGVGYNSERGRVYRKALRTIYDNAPDRDWETQTLCS